MGLGILTIVPRLGRTRFWLPVTLARVGGGSRFAWGLWSLVNVLGNTALVRDRATARPLVNLGSLVRLAAGLLIGVVTVWALAERTQQSGSESAPS